MSQPVPVTYVIPTRDRAACLARTLDSLLAQSQTPAEIIVVDSSSDDESRAVIADRSKPGSGTVVKWVRAQETGAAVQRNQGVALAGQPFIGFCDDDVLFEPECIERLWRAVQSDPAIGGASATIVNQRYSAPGTASRAMFRLLGGDRAASYAGRVIGPAVNLLPEDRDELPEVVPVEWLNLGCTIYRREALPSPPFDAMFSGYSMMEDLTLSLRVGRRWRLANARTARIYHDSQPGLHKADVRATAAMELVNRHYVMTEILGRTGAADWMRLVAWEGFQMVACLTDPQSRGTLAARLSGKWLAARRIRARRPLDAPSTNSRPVSPA